MKIIKENRRKIIRYLLFTKKNNTYDKPVISKKEDKKVLDYYENHENFTKWGDFETKWDIGIDDDPVAKANRKEKWFLQGKGKLDIVKRPQDYWEKEALRRKISTHSLYMQECQLRELTIEQFYKIFFN